MKHNTCFSNILSLVQLFCTFILVYDCIFLLSCYIVLLSCRLSFVVLLVLFYSDFTLLAVLCLITSLRLVLAWPRLALICHVLFCSCRFRLPLRVAFLVCFLRIVFCKSFFFHAALLYESPRRKPGWRFTAGSPLLRTIRTSTKQTKNTSKITDLRGGLKTADHCGAVWRAGGKPST